MLVYSYNEKIMKRLYSFHNIICPIEWISSVKARAIGFVGRGKERHVDYPFSIRPKSCKQCGSCIQLCPMTITPCDGPMKPGEEHL